MSPDAPHTTVTKLSRDELRNHVAQTRSQLAATLDALEEKANVPKQLKKSANRQAIRLRKLRRERPLVFAAIVVGGVAVSVGIVALFVKSATKR